jgi:dephospho-CoA kinase
MRIYGLTGGTGSGKSAAGERFIENGIPVIDADAVGHEVLEPDGPGYGPVVEAFGDAILTEGKIDRAKLGSIVFQDGPARMRLNAIVHPLIRQAVAGRFASLAQAGYDLAILDAALLSEDGQRDSRFSGLILVQAPVALRIDRLAEHRGIPREEAQRRIAAQTDPGKKLALADWVINNRGTLEELRDQVDTITEALKSHAP